MSLRRLKLERIDPVLSSSRTAQRRVKWRYVAHLQESVGAAAVALSQHEFRVLDQAPRRHAQAKSGAFWCNAKMDYVKFSSW